MDAEANNNDDNDDKRFSSFRRMKDVMGEMVEEVGSEI